jgi:benzoyl-CoA reductase/2-hydroxyglutaryl-CoA dehydratase subunit BcrC/BadD/HgdB
MNRILEPLIDDQYTGEPPSKRVLAYLQAQRSQGAKIVGTYCGYAPIEVIRALDLVPATLCAFSNATIEAAEAILPANLCPLIKSSYGFIVTDTCPFFGISDAVIAETTCDGKKKMFELIGDYKPLHVMDLPQLPDEPEALENWTTMIHKLKEFLERIFERTITDDRIEQAIRDSNEKVRKMNQVFDYVALDPPLVGWQELYDIFFLAQSARGSEMVPLFDSIINKLERRKKDGYVYGPSGAPRVMVTGCPVSGDASKVFHAIEEAGGVIVALEICSGMKPYMSLIEEGTGEPIRTLAAHYLQIPCSCMTPNDRRLVEMTKIIERFKPDAVVDVILQACHSYNIESFKVGEHIQEKHGLSFLKIVTDYSQSDVGQIRTRVEALLEICK